MEALLASFGVVALAELGDKTQFLTFYLAARYRRPLAVLAGVAIAAMLSSVLAALVGASLGRLLKPAILRWVLGASFLVMAGWAVWPERTREADPSPTLGRRGVVIGTVIAFFLAELGDKTQLATVALAARFDLWWVVALGTSAGMVAANLPAVLGGHFFAERVPVRAARYVAAAIFLVEGALTFAGIGLSG
jgi:Ca2+/H+ antiporter, TMEM165/GDT1 family